MEEIIGFSDKAKAVANALIKQEGFEYIGDITEYLVVSCFVIVAGEWRITGCYDYGIYAIWENTMFYKPMPKDTRIKEISDRRAFGEKVRTIAKLIVVTESLAIA